MRHWGSNPAHYLQCWATDRVQGYRRGNKKRTKKAGTVQWDDKWNGCRRSRKSGDYWVHCECDVRFVKIYGFSEVCVLLYLQQVHKHGLFLLQRFRRAKHRSRLGYGNQKNQDSNYEKNITNTKRLFCSKSGQLPLENAPKGALVELTWLNFSLTPFQCHHSVHYSNSETTLDLKLTKWKHAHQRENFLRQDHSSFEVCFMGHYYCQSHYPVLCLLYETSYRFKNICVQKTSVYMKWNVSKIVTAPL